MVRVLDLLVENSRNTFEQIVLDTKKAPRPKDCGLREQCLRINIYLLIIMGRAKTQRSGHTISLNGYNLVLKQI